MGKMRVTRNKKKPKIQNFFSYVVFGLGIIVLCVCLILIQNLSAERNQAKSSRIILEEVTQTLRNNNEIIENVFYEFDEINQTTISTLSSYIEYIDVFGPITEAVNNNQDPTPFVISTTESLSELCDDLSIKGILIFDDTGSVLLGSDASYIGTNVKDSVSEEDFANLAGYELDADGNVIKSGTMSWTQSSKIYSPVAIKHGDDVIYLYSTHFTINNGTNYFLLTYVPSTIIDHELQGIKQISSVLSGFTVGKSGFLFAVDLETKTFEYFDNGKYDLTKQSYRDYGLKDSSFEDNKAGYLSINGVSYYCVSKSFTSDAYGEFTVIAAVVTAEELLTKNAVSIIFGCVAFILVAGIISGYGLILKRDIADHLIFLEDKHRQNIREDNLNASIKLTNEEIEERTHIVIEEIIEKRQDKKLNRTLVGVRNKNGEQRYFSRYISLRLLSVTILGLAAIYLVSFFSQTLLGLNDATIISKNGLAEVVETIEHSEDNTDIIRQYVDNQFLSKARLFSNLLQETPDIIFDYADEEDIHRVYEYDENGNAVYLNYVDYPTVERTAVSNSRPLQETCDNNGVEAIYVYSDDGKVLATNTSEWYLNVSKNQNDASYVYNDILLDKVDDYIAKDIIQDKDGKLIKHIASEFFYYTTLEANAVKYVSKSDYQSYLNGTWTGNAIKAHRSLIEITVNQSTISKLFETSSMNYVLSNMHVYGESSFFIAFDNTEDHNIVYFPIEGSIGKKAKDIGMKDNAFQLTGVYNGFQTVNGVEYYHSVTLVGDYYIATAIPTDDIYASRNSVSLYTLLLSALFIIIASSLFTISSDKDDKAYCDSIKTNSGEENSTSFTIKTPSGKVKRTTSASSRFSKVKWSKKSPEAKLSAILMGYLTAASIFIVIALLAALNSRQDSIFTYILSGVWEKGFNIFAITEALMIMIIISTITRLAQVIVKSFCGNLGARVETTGNLIVSVLKYGGVIGGLFYCLYLFGFDTTSLLTSAGILSIVVGLGAQSLISDIIAGVFIVFEGEFRVGDIVTIGDFRGQVTEIGLRTTKIEDTSKNIKIFNNSSISGVLNMTKESSLAICTVGIEYGTSLERVENVLKEAFPKMRRKIPTIIDGPYYKGVSELGESSVNILIIAHCEEKDRIQLKRDLNREIFLLFKENNINIPFPQITLSQLKEEEDSASKKEQREAEEFVAEQKENSKSAETEEHN